jgi:NADPH-dependent dioxygenase
VRRLLRAQSWLLLAFTGDDAAVDGGLDLARDTPWLAVRTVTTRMPAQQRPGFRSDDRTVPDPDGWVHRALGAGAGTWILVRPDGYVAARGVLGKDELGAAVASLCETLAMTGHQLPAVPV